MTRPELPLVLHIIYSLGAGGLENGLVNLINRTPPGRYRHAVLCLTEAGDFAARIDDGEVPIIELGKRPGNDPIAWFRLWRLLRRLRPAIVHTRNLAALECQMLVLLAGRARRVHGEHGRDVFDLQGVNRKYLLLRRVMRRVVQRYVAVSRDLAGWLVEVVGVPQERVQPNLQRRRQASVPSPPGGGRGVPLPEGFLPGADAVVLGSVGRLAEVKDQRSILLALDQLLQRRPGWRDSLRFVLVGDGPLREDLLRQRRELGLEDILWMPGGRDDVAELLAAMDVFVLPSLAEGISNTVLEAMASGLPVIATDSGGNPELVTEGANGLLVPVGDVDRLADAMQTLVESEPLRRRLGQGGLERVRRDFDWDRAVGEYLAVYDRLLGRPGDSPGGERGGHDARRELSGLCVV